MWSGQGIGGPCGAARIQGGLWSGSGLEGCVHHPVLPCGPHKLRPSREAGSRERVLAELNSRKSLHRQREQARQGGRGRQGPAGLVPHAGTNRPCYG